MIVYVYVYVASTRRHADASYGLARYMNHSKANANLKGYLIVDQAKQLHCCFLANRDIEAGEALLIDYGERRRDVVRSFPWLKQ